MKISTPRYSCCLFFQLAFILCDLIFNCVSLFPRSRDGLLVLFIFQDLFLVLSITSILMSLFSTYLFQAGLVEAVVRKFRALAGAGAAYVLSALALHAAALLAHPAEPTAHPAEPTAHPAEPTAHHTDPTVHPAPATPTLLFLYTLHRCLAPWFYWVYKRAALQASDPRLHEDVDWLSRQQHAR